jgi:hypothetical protein
MLRQMVWKMKNIDGEEAKREEAKQEDAKR